MDPTLAITFGVGIGFIMFLFCTIVICICFSGKNKNSSESKRSLYTNPMIYSKGSVIKQPLKVPKLSQEARVKLAKNNYDITVVIDDEKTANIENHK